MATGGRSYTAGRFALVIDGFKNFGFLREVSGGAITANVITQGGGSGNTVSKTIGGPEYHDISVKIGMAMAPAMYEWIAASWTKHHMRKSGAIVSCDFDCNALFMRQFDHALITETTMPELNGASKEPAYMDVKFSPEDVRFRKGDGQKIQGEYGTGQQKRWLPSNFRLELGDMPCKKVNKIDKFTVKQVVTTETIGLIIGDGQKAPAKVEFPNIKVQLSQAHAPAWYAWFEDFAIKGNAGPGGEKQGRIVFLAHSGRELGSIELVNVGIFGVGDGKSEANLEQIKRIDVDLYVEEMRFVYNSADVIG